MEQLERQNSFDENKTWMFTDNTFLNETVLFGLVRKTVLITSIYMIRTEEHCNQVTKGSGKWLLIMVLTKKKILFLSVYGERINQPSIELR
jgi:hypothetical protein